MHTQLPWIAIVDVDLAVRQAMLRLLLQVGIWLKKGGTSLRSP